MTLGHSWLLYNEPEKVLNYILGIAGVFTLAYERNKMKYVWMNEADFVFAK